MQNRILLSRIPLVMLFILAFAVRMYKFDAPVADWHSWRQVDTSAVSRNFALHGFDFLHPRFDDLSNVPSGMDNPLGYRFVEFPIYNGLQAGLYALLKTFTIEQWGRLVSIFASLLSAVFLNALVSRYFSKKAGFLTAFFFLFLPFNIFYSRTILPDPSMVAAILGGVYFFVKWVEDQELKINGSFILAVLFTSCAFLLKPYALFFTLPMLWVAWVRYKHKIFLRPQLILFFFLCVLPLVGWRFWMTQYPEGIPSNNWLFNEGNIRFKGAFFHWLFGERIGKLILGYYGIILFGLGLLVRQVSQKQGILFAFLVSSLLYLTVIARGNVQHDYYQIAIIPTIAMFLGVGSSYLLSGFEKKRAITVFIVTTVFMFMFSWYHIRDFYNINNPAIVTAGNAVDGLIPKDAKIIAIYNGDTTFLYQTKRKGWASFQKDIEVMIDMGAQYLVFANPTESDYSLAVQFKIIKATEEYLLVDLTSK